MSTANRLGLSAARLLGKAASQIYAGEDLNTAFDFVLRNATLDADDRDYVLMRLREYADDLQIAERGGLNDEVVN